MQEKLAITVLVVTLALFALVMVLYDLMTNKKDDFNQIVLSQQEYDSRTIPFRRGDILWTATAPTLPRARRCII